VLIFGCADNYGHVEGGPPGSPLILDSSVKFQNNDDLLGAVEG
jgi:hypothetical protein